MPGSNDNSGYYQAAAAAGNTVAAAADSRKARKHQEKMLGLTQTYGREMADLGYQRSVDDWNRQNLYNLPSNQMGRLKDAGLNPHLIYGTGQASTGNATQAPHYQIPDTPDFQSVKPTPSGARHLVDSLPMVAQVSNFLLDTEAKKLANEERRQELAHNAARYPDVERILSMEAESKSTDLTYQASFKKLQQDDRRIAMMRAIEDYQRDYGADPNDSLNYRLRTTGDRKQGMKDLERVAVELKNELTGVDISKRRSEAEIQAVLANLAKMGLSAPVLSLIGLVAGGASGGILGRVMSGGKRLATRSKGRAHKSVRKSSRQAERDFEETTRRLRKFGKP